MTKFLICPYELIVCVDGFIFLWKLKHKRVLLGAVKSSSFHPQEDIWFLCIGKTNPHCRTFDTRETLTVYVTLYDIFCMSLLQLYDTHSISDILPPAPHTVNPSWEPIMLKPFTFAHNAGVMKMERRHKGRSLRDMSSETVQTGPVHLHPETAEIWGEIMCCASVPQLSSSHLASLSAHC